MRTSQTLLKTILSGLLPLVFSSCGGGPGVLSCTDIYVYGLTVTLKDSTTNQPICDAVVTAVDGSYSEQLEKHDFSKTDCSYGGAGERAGTYTLTAVKAGYMNATKNSVIVTSDSCHVKGAAVSLTMSR